MTYIDAPVSGTKAPAEKAQIRCSPAEIGRRCRTGVCGYLPRDAVVWRGGQQPENEAGPQCPADFDDAGYRGKRPAGEDAGLHPDQLWSAPEGGPLAAPYVKVKLDAIASEQFTPQMQLAHA